MFLELTPPLVNEQFILNASLIMAIKKSQVKDQSEGYTIYKLDVFLSENIFLRTASQLAHGTNFLKYEFTEEADRDKVYEAFKSGINITATIK